MKNFLLTALLGLLVLNPVSPVTTQTTDPRTIRQCGRIRNWVKEKSHVAANLALNDNSRVSSLASKILAECDKLDEKLLGELNSALYNREDRLSGIYPAGLVLKSYESVREIVDNIKKAGTAHGQHSEDLHFIIMYKAASLAPDVFVTIEKCNSNEKSELEVRLCNSMVGVFQKEIDNALTWLENAQLNPAGRGAELQFIERRVKELAEFRMEIGETTKKRIEKAIQDKSKLSWLNKLKKPF